jgi:histidyl-tRNA synthetase
MDKPQTLKGFRDFLPEQMAIRKRAIKILEDTFESFGFQPLQTPTLEYASLLMGKYGDEADKLVYTFDDRGGRKIGLNYDLTVPTARVLSQYPNLPKPFKRYQIQSSYRSENPQKGRYRQFTQCDIDTIGSSYPLSDAEIIAVIATALKALGFSEFFIFINSRPILYSIMRQLKIDEKDWPKVLQTIDKSLKVSGDELDQELASKGIKNLSYTKNISPLINKLSDNWSFGKNKTTTDDYLDEVLNLSEKFGISKTNLVFNPSIVRGLDYYTGPIFETFVKEPKIGSITGGGRYDHLIENLGGPNLPAVGTTLGLDRLCDCIQELNLWPNLSTASHLLISVFSKETLTVSQSLTQLLRNSLKTEIYLNDSTPLEKQIKYALAKSIPFIAILGPDEIEKNIVTIKNLKTREQKQYSLDDPIQITKDIQSALEPL